MNADLITIDIGSTFTKLCSFSAINSDDLTFLGNGLAYTSIEEGDVSIAIKNAIEDFKRKQGLTEFSWGDSIICCSAAGGLSMSVHGLVADMTVKAAKEAALGAGAVIKYSTAGRILDFDLETIKDLNPKLILLTGGVDHGEKKIIIENAQKLAKLEINTPIIFAGNTAAKKQVETIFKNEKKDFVITENVYPQIDQLNIRPTKEKIYQIFERNIVNAPGMEKIGKYTNRPILPTPLAVMKMAELAAESLPDLLVIDLGGATTDIHSITDGSEDNNHFQLAPEPREKRTVEGDLGVFINKNNILELMDVYECYEFEKLGFELNILGKKPETELEAKALELLAIKAIKEALKRHAGKLVFEYFSNGKITFTKGKDLSVIKNIIGTGGFLANANYLIDFWQRLFEKQDKSLLLPDRKKINYYQDNNYLMSCLGAMSTYYPKQAQKLLLKNLKKL